MKTNRLVRSHKGAAFMALLFLGCHALPGIHKASGAVLFYDNFDNGAGTTSNQAPAGWTASNGTVDIIAHGFLSLPCLGGAGECVDLDGSSNDAGVLTSNTVFNLTAGNTYVLTYYLAGNNRGFPADRVTVSFGGESVGHTLSSAVPYTQFSLTVSPLVNLTNQAIVFDHQGGDNVGILLDDVMLEEVPEPSTLVLFGTAFGVLLGMMRRRQ